MRRIALQTTTAMHSTRLYPRMPYLMNNFCFEPNYFFAEHVDEDVDTHFYLGEIMGVPVLLA
jgi:hypothetical protein